MTTTEPTNARPPRNNSGGRNVDDNIPPPKPNIVLAALQKTVDFINAALTIIVYGIITAMKVALPLIVIGVFWLQIRHTTSFVQTLVAQRACSYPLFGWFLPCDLLLGQTWNQTTNERPFPLSEFVDVQSRFVGLMESSGYGLSMALDMSVTEIAASNMKAEILESNLKSKDELANALGSYASTAEALIPRLSNFDSDLGGAFNDLLSINDWAIAELESVKRYEGGASILSFLAPYLSLSSREDVVQIYLQAAGRMEKVIIQLIDEAISIDVDLKDSRKKLGFIKRGLLKENHGIHAFEDELKSGLIAKATFNYFNKAALHNTRNDQQFLSEIEKGRGMAETYVEKTRFELQQIHSNLRTLRKALASTRFKSDADLPLERQVKQLNELTDDISKKHSKHEQRRDRARRMNRERGLGIEPAPFRA